MIIRHGPCLMTGPSQGRLSSSVTPILLRWMAWYCLLRYRVSAIYHWRGSMGINGELTVKRIRIRKNKLTLVAENDAYRSQEINDQMEFEVWGVVTNVIHAL